MFEPVLCMFKEVLNLQFPFGALKTASPDQTAFERNPLASICVPSTGKMKVVFSFPSFSSSLPFVTMRMTAHTLAAPPAAVITGENTKRPSILPFGGMFWGEKMTFFDSQQRGSSFPGAPTETHALSRPESDGLGRLKRSNRNSRGEGDSAGLDGWRDRPQFPLLSSGCRAQNRTL